MVRAFDSHYIGGRWVRPASTDVHTSVNPATEQPIGCVPAAGPVDVTNAIAAARTAFDDGPWPQSTPRERAAVMANMAAVMRRRQRELVDLDIAEAGRARYLAEHLFVDGAISHWEDMVERVLPTFAFSEPQPPFVNAATVGQGVVQRRPYGVGSIITPFNAPFFLGVIKAAAALAAGCTVVLKPSPLTPLSSFVLAEITDESGLPPGVLNVLSADGDAAAMLTTDPRIDIVSFTGSDQVGKSVYAQSAPTLKKVVLELGGKSANVICEDADLAKVIPDVLANFTVNCGQGCGLLTRTLVHESIYDEVVSGLLVAVEQEKIGDPADPTVTMGPLISERQRAAVERLVAAGVAEGATLATGGRRPPDLQRGFFFEPTVFTRVDNAMSIAQKEFFGPVTTVIGFRDDEQAVRLANDSAYGLAAGVWSSNALRAYEIGSRIRAGYITINGGHSGLSPHSAFGGYKSSGLGREWGSHGLSEFLQHSTLVWPVAGG
jgi:acyl-CoA reductase-like NAD-dependent aldehyde dehydrogenase